MMVPFLNATRMASCVALSASATTGDSGEGNSAINVPNVGWKFSSQPAWLDFVKEAFRPQFVRFPLSKRRQSGLRSSNSQLNMKHWGASIASLHCVSCQCALITCWHMFQRRSKAASNWAISKRQTRLRRMLAFSRSKRTNKNLPSALTLAAMALCGNGSCHWSSRKQKNQRKPI